MFASECEQKRATRCAIKGPNLRAEIPESWYVILKYHFHSIVLVQIGVPEDSRLVFLISTS